MKYFTLFTGCLFNALVGQAQVFAPTAEFCTKLHIDSVHVSQVSAGRRDTVIDKYYRFDRAREVLYFALPKRKAREWIELPDAASDRIIQERLAPLSERLPLWALPAVRSADNIVVDRDSLERIASVQYSRPSMRSPRFRLHVFTYGTNTVSDSTFNLYGGIQTKWTGTSVYHFNSIGQVVYVEKTGPSPNDNRITHLFYAKDGLPEAERVRYRDGIGYDSVYEFFITP